MNNATIAAVLMALGLKQKPMVTKNNKVTLEDQILKDLSNSPLFYEKKEQKIPRSFSYSMDRTYMRNAPRTRIGDEEEDDGL